MKIIVDAMGGDHAPQAFLEGSFRAAQTLGIRAPIMLVGGIAITLTMDTGLASQIRL